MANRKRKRLRKRKDRRGPVFFKHPLSELPRDKVLPALIHYADASKAAFRETLEVVLKILRSSEPLQIIATLAVFGLSCRIDDEGNYKSLLNNSQFTQAHVELAQSLSLTIPPGQIPITPPDGRDIQQMFDLLPKLGQFFIYQRMVTMEDERTDEQKAILLVQELLRTHTQSVRNWGYFDKVRRIVDELYKPLDDAFIKHIGVSATQLAAAFLHLVRESERRMNAVLKQLPQVFRVGGVAAMLRKYYELNPQFVGGSEEMLALVKRERLSVGQTKSLILAHIEYRLPDLYTFSATSIAAQLGIGAAAMRGAFDKLSLSFGDLASHQIERLLLDNPVWQKPVIILGDDQYFCAIPQMFFSFVRPILDYLIGDNGELGQACGRRRAEFLESELEKLFAKAFPGAEIVAGFRWRSGDAEYENDLIVRIDSHLLLIEAKSGTVSWPALRGAPERAKKHIDDLIVAPSIQSARLAERIEAVIKSPELRDAYLPGLGVRLDRVHTVVRLSVTLEDFAMIQANLSQLRATGWLPSQHTLSPCILLTDLEILFEILEPVGQKIHYLRRRTELATHLVSMGDELDHLGLYLENGFNIGESEFGEVALQLVEMSKEIDVFCVARAEGKKVKKPRLRMGKWWSDICAQVEQRAFDRWTDVYNMLMSLSPYEQEKAERMFQKVVRALRRTTKAPSEKDCVVAIPTPRKTIAVVLFAFRDADSGTRHERMQSIASETFEHPHVKSCLVVAVNVDGKAYPYATLAVVYPNESREQTQCGDLQVY